MMAMIRIKRSYTVAKSVLIVFFSFPLFLDLQHNLLSSVIKNDKYCIHKVDFGFFFQSEEVIFG
jgi:hypothetical protein